MENWISILISSIILDILSSFLLKVAFKLKSSTAMIIFLQVLNIVPVVMYIFLPLTFFQFFLIKIFMWFVFTLLVTENYKIKSLFALFFWLLMIMFSVYGLAWFLVLYVKSAICELFKIKINFLQDFVLLICLLCYFACLFALTKILDKEKTLKKFLSKVSFYAFGKHIEITGLLDSGNCLYDTKTGKAVMVVSVDVLKNVLPKADYSKVKTGDYSSLSVSHYIKFVSVGGNSADMPIIDIGSVNVKVNGTVKNYKCVMGLVGQKLDSDGNFKCLLHRDFV